MLLYYHSERIHIMAKLINVIKEGEGELDKRQLPLVIDEKLTVSMN